ncbi:DUF6794 domain-containing protein [Aquimarina algicola]|uniref:DUF6794 domain-containing protein n=1 Tax=Aquimarina algicola TaxID=2589995 RepID=A0A504IXN2_9FLAO|nr:DUF6794 domain-containing protein [Aquimarina algicola]TPN82814.1 hypothetical protein FHK87_20520 [Aquimarina algicola]
MRKTKNRIIKIVVFCLLIHLCISSCKTTERVDYFIPESEYSALEEIPENLGRANEILNTTFSDSLKNLVRNADNDTIINIVYPYSLDYLVEDSPPMFVWYNKIKNKRKGKEKNTRFVKYLNRNGIEDIDLINEVVLVAFKNYLNKQDTPHKELLKQYRSKQKVIDAREKTRFITDTLFGVYIPKDIEDCLVQLDKVLGDATQQKAVDWSENNFVSTAYLSIGYRIRNRWQITNGSRLSKYFSKLGVRDPEEVTSIIFTSYSRYKKGKPILFKEQIKQ